MSFHYLQFSSTIIVKNHLLKLHNVEKHSGLTAYLRAVYLCVYTVLYRCNYGPGAREAGLKRVGEGMCPDRGMGGGGGACSHNKISGKSAWYSP
jgi:hypothetical protein